VDQEQYRRILRQTGRMFAVDIQLYTTFLRPVFRAVDLCHVLLRYIQRAAIIAPPA
jgi:hypothetical protein